MKQSIVIVAYACSPQGLSEQWLGWKWAQAASESGNVILVTRPDRPGLREVCDENGIELLEVAVPATIREYTQKLGDFGMWLRVHAWANKVRKIVSAIGSSENVRYGHVVTFHSVQMPSVFDGCTFTKVWGPASGMEYIPNSYLRYLGPDRLKESLRNLLIKMTTANVQKRAADYDVILYGNTQTMEAVERSRKGVNRVVMPNNIDSGSGNFTHRTWNPGDELKLLFVGSCQARRALPLVLEALAKLKHLTWSVNVAGTGSGLNYWKSVSEGLGVSDRVTFHGWIDRETVDQLYQNSHLFVFPSLRDGGGSGMLEAIDRGLPVLALDWGGPADVIGTSGAGHLFPVSAPDRTIKAIREWLEDLFEGRILYSTLISATRDFNVHQFSWEFKSNALRDALTEADSRASQHDSLT